jgi:hypothetical protein
MLERSTKATTMHIQSSPKLRLEEIINERGTLRPEVVGRDTRGRHGLDGQDLTLWLSSTPLPRKSGFPEQQYRAFVTWLTGLVGNPSTMGADEREVFERLCALARASPATPTPGTGLPPRGAGVGGGYNVPPPPQAVSDWLHNHLGLFPARNQ